MLAEDVPRYSSAGRPSGWNMKGTVQNVTESPLLGRLQHDTLLLATDGNIVIFSLIHGSTVNFGNLNGNPALLLNRPLQDRDHLLQEGVIGLSEPFFHDLIQG